MNSYSASKSLRIGIDARLWNETGVGRYIRNLVWELAQIDRENEYILFFKENEFKNVEIPGKNFRKVLADIHWHSLQEQLSFVKILSREDLDIVHFPYFSLPIFYRKPFIVTIHDLIINHYPTGKASTRNALFYWLKFFGYTFVVRQAIRRARKVIAVSQATKAEIVKDYPVGPTKIHVTYEGIDKKIFHAPSQKPAISFPYFLYVGNAYPHKNLDRLVEAFSSYKKNNPLTQTKLILVGKEDFFYRRLKVKVKALGLLEDVLFYEKVSDGGLASMYRHALALVAPSLMEGFGLPLLEAMSFGSLVIASNIPVYREIAKDIPLYFDPASITTLAERLFQVAEGKVKDTARRKQNGKEVVKDFSWEKMARETLQIYESCISVR